MASGLYLKSLKFRLTTVFSAAFIFGTGALYVVSYALVSNFLQQEDERLLQAKLLEFWAVYQTGRIAAVQREFSPENFVTESTAFFVRIAGRDNQTLLRFRPATWREYDLDSLEAIEPPQDGSFFNLPRAADGSVVTVASVRVFDGNYLQVGVSNRHREKLLASLLRVYLLVALPFIVVGVVGGWLVSSRGLTPVKKLSTLTRFIIETGELSWRIPVRGSRDELDELTILFNRMLERMETLVSGMRSSLDNVAHDLRTPMTRIRMKAEMARSDANPENHEVFDSIVSETDQMLTMMKTLMDISGAETGVMRLDHERIDFARVIRDIAELYGYSAAELDIAVTANIAEPLPVFVDVNRMRQVVANLLDNAVKYSSTGGAVEIHGYTASGSVHIDVSDNGVGIEPEALPRIWDRLFRGDRSRSQPGLGLGLVKAIVEAHGGSVSVVSPIGADGEAPGSRFGFTIPLAMPGSPPGDTK